MFSNNGGFEWVTVQCAGQKIDLMYIKWLADIRTEWKIICWSLWIFAEAHWRSLCHANLFKIVFILCFEHIDHLEFQMSLFVGVCLYQTMLRDPAYANLFCQMQISNGSIWMGCRHALSGSAFYPFALALEPDFNLAWLSHTYVRKNRK